MALVDYQTRDEAMQIIPDGEYHVAVFDTKFTPITSNNDGVTRPATECKFRVLAGEYKGREFKTLVFCNVYADGASPNAKPNALAMELMTRSGKFAFGTRFDTLNLLEIKGCDLVVRVKNRGGFVNLSEFGVWAPSDPDSKIAGVPRDPAAADQVRAAVSGGATQEAQAPAEANALAGLG